MLSNPIFYIAKKEIMDNIRNKWIIVVSIIFASLAILVSYAASMGQGWQNLVFTVIGMLALVQILIPIIGLMLGYAAIVGEIERGSMNSLISLPVTRFEIIVGKFLGLGAVLSSTIIFGFGIAGIIIAINLPNVNYGGYMVFIGATILIGLVFLSLSLLFSSFFKRRTASMGMAIFAWFFFNIIWDIIVMGIGVGAIGSDKFMLQTWPGWLHGLNLVNPVSAFSGLVSINIIDQSSIPAEFSNGLRQSFPSFYTSGTMLIILFIWIIIPLILSYLFFKRRDV